MEDSVSLLEDILKIVAKEHKFSNFKSNIKQISTGGANYTGNLFLISISETGRDDLKLFAKVAALGEKMREKAQVYKTESFFYNNLIKKYNELEDSYNVPEKDRLMVPKFYGGSNEYMKEVLLLEDLSVREFEAFDRFKSLTWEQASKSVEQLAKLHALSLALSVKKPEEFEKAKNFFKTPGEDDVKNFKLFLGSIKPKVYETTRSENQNRVRTFIEDTINSENFIYLIKSIKRSVIIHGDYRPNNLMYTNKEPLQAIPLDFQTLRCGTPLYDLLYFLNLGSDNKFRHQYFQATIDHYYSELCSALRRLDVKPDEVYSKDDFQYEYKQLLPYLAMISMCILLVVTVDEENAPKGKELEDLDIESYSFEPNEFFNEKLNELIDFYIGKGVL